MDIEFDISFCLTAPEELDQLRAFLEAVERHSEPAACQVIAVGGNLQSDQPAGRRLQKDFPNLLCYENRPEKWGRLINHALRIARGRYLAPWSARVHPLPGCLPALLDFLDQETTTAIAAPRLVEEQGRTLPTARRQPGLPVLLLLHTVLGQAGLGGPLLKRHYYADQPPVLSQAAVDWLSGRALLIRRTALEEIGFFDEDFSALYADADYCRRARRLGWHCHYLAGAVARELEPERHRPDYLLKHRRPGHLADATRLLLKKWWRL